MRDFKGFVEKSKYRKMMYDRMTEINRNCSIENEEV